MPQNLNRYSYSVNDPISHLDQTGHEWTEIDRFSLTISQFETLISDLRNWKALLEVEAAVLLLASPFLAAAAGPIAVMGSLAWYESAQIDWLLDYLGDAVAEAEQRANYEADQLGLSGEDRQAYIDNYTFDIIVSDVTGEGFWYNSGVVITTSVTPDVGNYLFLGAAAALSWEYM
ncbi:MAG: hypothetical protein IT327_16630 [Anaerolineae bacterium]|nr:hypothetical protein [Anaerolineae bacterium]